MKDQIVPFGKHKGKSVEALLDDGPYLEWLLSQSWFKEKFGNVYNIVINAGNEPVDTPEHNQMQVRFLDKDFQSRLFRKFGCNPSLMGMPIFERDGVDVFIQSGRWFDTLCVEIKPEVGDDFPAVLRQINRYKQSRNSSGGQSYDGAKWILLIRRYSGSNVTLEQFREFFQSQRVVVVFESEI